MNFKHLILFVSFILNQTLNAQCRIDSIYISNINVFNFIDPNTRFFHHYNKKEEIIGSTFQIWNTIKNIWVNKKKDILTLNDSAEITEKLHLLWDDKLNEWVNNYKNVNLFNNLDLISNKQYFEWDIKFKKWILKSETQYLYNSDNLLIENIHKDWNVQYSYLVNQNKELRTYNSNNKIIQTIRIIWDNDKYKWVNEYKTEKEYDINFNIIEESNYIWKAGKWEGYYKVKKIFEGVKTFETEEYVWKNDKWLENIKVINTYDANKNILDSIKQKWNEDSSKFKNDLKFEFKYNIINKNVNIDIYGWNKLKNEFVLLNHQNDIFDSLNNLIKSEFYSRQNIDSSLVLYKYWDFSYNSFNKCTAQILKQKALKGNFFNNDEKQEFEYDIIGNIILLNYFYFLNNDWFLHRSYQYGFTQNNLIKEEIKKFQSINNEFVIYHQKFYNYDNDKNLKSINYYYNNADNLRNSDGHCERFSESHTLTEYRCKISSTVGIKYSKKENSIKIYPNPVSNNLFNVYTPISGLMQLFSIEGKLIFENQLVQGVNQIQLNLAIKDGIYIVKMDDENYKLILKKN